MESVTLNVTPRGRASHPPPLIKPKALSAFLRIALGDGVDAVGFVDTRGARLLGWEDVDEARGRTDIGWLIASVLSEGVSTLKGHRVASTTLLQGRFSLVLVSLGSVCSASTMLAKLEEMKRVLEAQHLAALAKLSETSKADETA